MFCIKGSEAGTLSGLGVNIFGSKLYLSQRKPLEYHELGGVNPLGYH